ncbi:restriction endonuclease subunit S [Heyndrickxia coagulans]|uniref:restriction endonuclease subunit S n=1 Tax=Heyndrickxia coagulans TaxID=1398 RepID=UPI0002DECCF5|nr:restriction endonuclease subunit S [Heyndrickxia coagulans]
MQEWKVYEFKELVNLSKEKYNPKSETMNLPCIELEHIESETGRLLGYTNSIEQQSIKNKFKANDILYGKLRPYLRKFYFPNFEGVCSSEIWVLQSIEEKIHNKYLYYLIQTNKFNEHANKSSGTKMPRADWNYISEITFPIPPIKEQQKIASILSTWDKAIELKEKLIEQKKQQKKGLMQKLLTGEVRLPGFEGEWKTKKLKDLCTKIMDGTHATPNYTESGIPFYSVENVTNRDFSNHKYISYEEHLTISSRCKVEKGDILMTRIGSIGDAVLVDWDYESSIYVSLALIKTNEKILSEYLVHYMATDKFKKDILSKSLLSAIPQKINLVDIGRVNIYFPQDIQEQQAIAKILNDAEKEISLLEKELDNVRQQKKGLMQLLLTGKVRVKV